MAPVPRLTRTDSNASKTPSTSFESMMVATVARLGSQHVSMTASSYNLNECDEHESWSSVMNDEPDAVVPLATIPNLLHAAVGKANASSVLADT